MERRVCQSKQDDDWTTIEYLLAPDMNWTSRYVCVLISDQVIVHFYSLLRAQGLVTILWLVKAVWSTGVLH